MSKEFFEKVRPQDDLFQYVNGNWLESAVIPDDRPVAGGFAELDEGVKKTMIADFNAFADGSKPIPNDYMKRAVLLFKKGLDTKRRNEEGIKPLLSRLATIRALKDVGEVNARAKELFFESAAFPIPFSVEPDMKDTQHRVVIFMGPRLILPDVPYYDPANPTGQALLGIFSQMAKALLAYTPLSPEEQNAVLEGALRYDAGLSKIEKTSQEWSEYTKCYNPYSLDDAAKFFGDFDLKGFLKSLYGEKMPDKVIAYDPKFLEGFTTVYSADKFEDFKSWAYLTCLVRNSAFLSEELREIGGTYQKALMGTPKLESIEKQAYGLASGLLSEPVGLYYGETYFGEAAKADVIAMVKSIIATYQRRIKENDFLSEKTKEKAILKLGTMAVKMGYPDKVDPMYDTLLVEEGDSLLEAIAKISIARKKWAFDHLGDPTDRDEWPMPGHMVNACYNPNNNDITFPAAILQKPFYDFHQLPEENLGGIGAVIGHEISHAFDNNGAQCDEYGNLKNWWTKEDFDEFNKRTQKMVEQWDGIPFAGGKVNGALVVSENIADNGGMAVVLDIMSRRENPDYKAFFYNWARVWCQKAQPQYQQLLLAVDVHSPAPLRANITPRNFAEWYQVFDVKETDQMYIPADKRIGIW